MLVRDYLKRSLYEAKSGYFSQTSPIISSKGNKIDFNQIKGGQRGWFKARQHFFESMKEEKGDWITQTELFAPYFSQVLTEWAIKKVHQENENDSLRILEIGGGNGTNALHFLNHLKTSYPDYYRNTQYVLCEISPTLSKIQRENLHKDHKEVCTIENRDFLKWNKRLKEKWIILAIEVLDNLPHDKILYKDDVLPDNFVDSDLNKWEEILVEEWGVEKRRKLRDPIAIEAAQYFINKQISAVKRNFNWSIDGLLTETNKYLTLRKRNKKEKFAKSVFVPSDLVQFLHTVNNNFDDHTLICVDFAFLPYPEIEDSKINRSMQGSLFHSRNVPIVSGKHKSNYQIDYPSYIVPNPSHFDIFFQTDFECLQTAYRNITKGGISLIQTSKEFMTENTPEDVKLKTNTMNGFNPMLEDFENVSFFIGRKRQNK